MEAWYEKSFGHDYLIVYKHRDVQGAYAEVRKMVDWLRLPDGAQILDLCCGTGRHSLALADFGYNVTGIDLSEVLLKQAVQSDEEKRVRWIRGDMRSIPVQGPYDAVVNLFTSFGYFDTEEENVQVLREIRRVLKPGGGFILDFLNPAYVERHLVPASERETDGLRIRERRSIELGCVVKRIEISDVHEPTLEPRTYIEKVRLFRPDQFREMMHRAGLVIDAMHGGYDQSDYDEASSVRQIYVGHAAEEALF